MKLTMAVRFNVAAAIGMSTIRAAFHAAGAATPDWPLFDELSIGAGELLGV